MSSMTVDLSILLFAVTQHLYSYDSTISQDTS